MPATASTQNAPSATAMIFVPLPRFVFRPCTLFFSGRETWVDKCFTDIDCASDTEFVRKGSHDPRHYAEPNLLLKSPMTGLERGYRSGRSAQGAPVRKTHRNRLFAEDRRPHPPLVTKHRQAHRHRLRLRQRYLARPVPDDCRPASLAPARHKAWRPQQPRSPRLP